MSTTSWKTPANIIRGVVFEATDSSSLQELATMECWERVAGLSRSLSNPSETISVMCEIWPDTGRIIWILKDRREFCRVELSIPALEQHYFEISATNDFEREYKVLFGVIKNALRKGFERVDPSYAQRIAVRDSDDATTEESLN